MKTIIARFISKLDGMFGKRVVRGFFALVGVLLIVGIGLRIGGSPAPTTTEVPAKAVRVETVENLMRASTGFTTIGTVRAVSEAQLQVEAGGRVTAVYAGIGDRVAAGAVLASMENSRERAALLSAEGAYESALVASSQVETGAASAYRAGYTAANEAVRNLADELFTNPLPEQGVIGFRFATTGTSGSAASLNAERRALEEVLRAWERSLATADESNAGALLAGAERDLARVGAFIGRLGSIFAASDSNASISAEEQASYRARFAAARAGLDQTLAALSSARTQYQNPSAASQTGAILKQAQGALAAARAAYEQTLVRTPIAGVVNAFYLRANEYATMGAPAAVVANNAALEITTSVGARDRERIAVGGRVRIDGAYDGVITRVAPALDPLSGMVEVRIAAEEARGLENGSTVSVTFERAAETAGGPVSIPLESVKILPDGAAVFVVENDALVAVPVELGNVVGGTIVVTDGLSPDMRIVTDVRGLRDGQAVSVIND